MPDLVAVIGGYALQSANRNGLAVHSFAAACGLAGAIAGAAQNAGKDVRFAVEQVSVGVSALRDEADVFRHIGVGGAGPLTIHNFVEVVRVAERLSVSRRRSFYTHSSIFGEINIRS